MFGNYVKIAWRSLWKHKLFSTIIFGGLAVGMAAILFIAIYLRSELSFDNFHANGKDLYRAGFRTWQKGALLQDDPAFTAPFGIYAKSAFPEIQSVCRISEQHEAWLNYAGKSIKSSNITYADSSFFALFSFKLLAGNPGKALDEPHAIVLTERLSKKIFGNIEPIGKRITLDGKADYLVTGLVADPPYHSTLQFDALISLSTLYHDSTVFMDWNGGWQYQHYLELQPGADYERLAAKFKNFMASNYNQKYAGNTQTDAYLQPFAQIHLKYESDSAGRRTNIYVFMVIALLILSIACINYINLSVAKASSRYKEIGIRKVLGAFRLQLVLQFLGESVLVTALSFLLGLVLVIGLLPAYEYLSGQTIRFSWHDVLFVLGMFLVFVFIISLAAGSYLALYLSSFSPVSSLKKFWLAGKRANAANTLVVLQFCISAALISVVFVVNLQVRFVKNRPLGFDKEHILVLPLTSDLARDKASLLKQNILRLSSVSAASAMSEIPYDDIAKNGFLPEGTNTHIMAHQLDADEDLLKTLHIQLVAGRYFSAGDPRSAECYLVNQAFADKLGWKDPLNKIIKRDTRHRVIGLVSNFHFASLHDKIEPLIITNRPDFNRYGFLAIRYDGNEPALLISQLTAIWRQTGIDVPFDYWFLDSAYHNLYKAEERFRQLFLYFSLVSIVLSLSGVLGLSLLNIQQKTKEIGIRKILGADVWSIVSLALKQFVVNILIAVVIAVPLAWIYTNFWLRDFAYRIVLVWWMFVLSGIVVLMLASIIIGVQAIRAARGNPIRSLRSE